MTKILENISLKPYNTFGLDATARYYAQVKTEEELTWVLDSSTASDNPILLLGGGSNLLFCHDFPGLVIHIRMEGIEVLTESEDQVTIRVGAGHIWHELVRYCVEKNWGGIENLSLIPGTVGAAPIQNIGAYGVELKETFRELRALEIGSGKVVTFDHEQCRFGYRDSYFKKEGKGKYVILSVDLTLNKKPTFQIEYGAIQKTLEEMNVTHLNIQTISDAVIRIRQSKLPDPAVIGNAGSFFKNPSIDSIDFECLKAEFPEVPGYPVNSQLTKVPAAWLIDQCGWKGYREGNIGVHKDQALVLVNYGGGKGTGITDLAMRIRQSVREKFGIVLEPEVNIID